MPLDPVPIVFYATVCGLLTAVAPPALLWPWRMLIGAAVGIVAAIALPTLRLTLGV